MDRSVNWLIDKIIDSNLDPIEIKPADLENFQDI